MCFFERWKFAWRPPPGAQFAPWEEPHRTPFLLSRRADAGIVAAQLRPSLKGLRRLHPEADMIISEPERDRHKGAVGWAELQRAPDGRLKGDPWAAYRAHLHDFRPAR